MKIKRFLDKYFSTAARVTIILALLSAVIFVVSKLSEGFSDFFNRYISSFFRLIFSKITGILPFSLGEAMVLCLPLFVFVTMFLYFKVYSKDEVQAGRFIVTLISCISVMFTSFVFMFGVAYNGTDLSHKLGLESKEVSYEELEYTAKALMKELDAVADEVEYRYDGASVMPYSFGELNQKLNEAYMSFCDDNSFLPRLTSRVKILAVSPVMTYTHISGIFTYYTGEANVNVNYPDYSMPYTMAHEMAHQRGVAPEDEANFVAFLVCLRSEDPYIRYSGCMSVLEYVLGAMHTASARDYEQFIDQLDLRLRGEMIAFSDFFTPYRGSVASEVADAVNDSYLKASGEKAGSASYGMVVDLTCAYFRSDVNEEDA